MLSRVANSIFWMSRYIERSENVARFIDVNWHMNLDSTMRLEEQWHALVNTSGDHEDFIERYKEATQNNVFQFLTFDTENPNSIMSCVRAARENARSIRDAISSEMWEQLNTFYLMLNDSSASRKAMENPYEFFNSVKLASHLFCGVTDTTMSHNEGWNFCQLGRFLERTDKTSRILDVKHYMRDENAESRPADDIQWAAVLKSASALEMYRKRYRRISPDRVIEFLLLDREFPRAVLACLLKSDEALHTITGSPRGSYTCPPERHLGLLCAELGYADLSTVLESSLHDYVDQLQTKLNTIGEAIYTTFFSIPQEAAKEAAKEAIKEPAAESPKQTQKQTQTQTQTRL
jgi:uncharacterized alpha-E superfamily protein